MGVTKGEYLSLHKDVVGLKLVQNVGRERSGEGQII